MNWTHLHLALNHVPVLGVPFVTLLLAWGWLFRKPEVIRVAVLWTLGIAAASIAIKFTGDSAAEVDPSRFLPVQELLERHEKSADQATTAVFVWGLAAAVATWLGRGQKAVPAPVLGMLMALGVVTCVLLARTANVGGQISHPQIREGAAAVAPGGKL
jgi:hypothetical protein